MNDMLQQYIMDRSAWNYIYFHIHFVGVFIYVRNYSQRIAYFHSNIDLESGPFFVIKIVQHR